MSPRALFDHPTVAELATAVGGTDPSASGETAVAALVPAPSRPARIPLSFAQERLWFLDDFARGTNEYISLLGLRLTGNLNREALREALSVLADRHESLRTTFDTVDGQGVQVVHSEMELPVRFVDLTSATEEERDQERDRLLLAETRTPFDLRTGPLVRVLL
ncbi:condensation domain-containing protein, partial [Actinoalloteichus spitiensis]|uniref:condensation domain-containing protein n=1 Tax=Actinoalloteichus spitiensis TaxID=252394 RepID=UPI001FE08CF5